MSKAVDSNSTHASGIHPAAALIEQRLDSLSGIFQAYRVITETMPDTGSAAKPADTDTTLTRIAAQFEQQKDTIKTLVQTVAMQHTGYSDGNRIKRLRDEFIADKLAQGIAVEEISQVLNLPLSAVDRIIAQLHPEQEKENAAI